MLWLDSNPHLSGSEADTLNEMVPGKGLAHRRARCEPLVTCQPWTGVVNRITAIISLTTSRPWGSCGQALDVYSLFVELQAKLELRERRGTYAQSSNEWVS